MKLQEGINENAWNEELDKLIKEIEDQVALAKKASNPMEKQLKMTFIGLHLKQRLGDT